MRMYTRMRAAGALVLAFALVGCSSGSTQDEPDAGMTGEPDAGMTGEPDAGMTGEPDAGMTDPDGGADPDGGMTDPDGGMDGGMTDPDGGMDGGTPTCDPQACEGAEVCDEVTDACVCPDTACLIDGACVAAGTVDAAQSCQACDPTASTTDWTLLPADTVCRAAADTCDLAEVCTGSSAECPEDLWDEDCLCTVGADLGDLGDLSTATAGFRINDAWAFSQTALEADEYLHLVWADLFDGWGVFQGGMAPGTYLLDDDFAECGLCFSMRTNWDPEESGWADDSKFFIQRAGTVAVSDVGLDGTLTMEVSNLELVEAVYDEVDEVWEVVDMGCETVIASYSFSVPVAPPTCEYGDWGHRPDAAAGRTVEGDRVISYADLHHDTDAQLLDYLLVTLWEGYGAMSGGSAPGTYVIEGDETNIEDCGVCVRLVTDYDTEDDVLSDTTQIFMATGGTVTLTEIGTAGSGNFTAEVSDLTFAPMVGYEGTCTEHVVAGASWSTPMGTYTP
jgi:hypothetical protein